MLRTLWKVVHGLRIQQLCLVNAFSIPRFQSLDLDFSEFVSVRVLFDCCFPACLSVRVMRTHTLISSHETAQTSSHFAVLTHMFIDPQLVI